jgi:hypothetical protein
VLPKVSGNSRPFFSLERQFKQEKGDNKDALHLPDVFGDGAADERAALLHPPDASARQRRKPAKRHNDTRATQKTLLEKKAGRNRRPRNKDSTHQKQRGREV